jgi:hypothetical protein
VAQLPPSSRPLPGEPLHSVELILDHAALNPYDAKEVSLDRCAVARLVKRRYLETEPWPFTRWTNRCARSRLGEPGDGLADRVRHARLRSCRWAARLSVAEAATP